MPAQKTQFLLQTDANAWLDQQGRNLSIDPRQLTYNKTTDLAGPDRCGEYDGHDPEPATKRQ